MRPVRCVPILFFAVTAAAQGWTPIGSPKWLLSFPEVVTDSARQRLLTVDELGITWEWDGSLWREVGHGEPNSRIVYHAGRQRVFMTAVQTAATQSEWNGHAWVPVPGTHPGVAPMAYDGVRNRVVMIDSLNQLHEWDGARWTQHGTAPTQAWPRLVYDRARGRLLVLSHANLGTPMLTHSWNGTTWQQLANQGPLDPHYGVADDPLRGRVVLHGGGAMASTSATWEWNGTQWTLVQNGGPLQRRNHALAFDPVRGQVLAFGGVRGQEAALQDAFAWNGATWQQVAELAPASRLLFASMHDPGNARFYVHGGRVDTVLDGELWRFDGRRWARLVAAGGPAPRAGHAMAASLNGGVLLFGGWTAAGPQADCWHFDGAAWTAIQAPGPSVRGSHGMATDLARGRVVLHGGSTGVFTQLRDTWEWDGAQWFQVASNGPASLFGPILMTYDPVLGGVVMHADYIQNGTWLWNGSQWTSLAPALPRQELGLAFDPVVGTTLAFVRTNVGGRIDALRLGSGAWLPMPPLPYLRGGFDGSSLPGLAYDHRGRMLLYTGTFLWSSSATPAAATDIGPPCTDPAAALPLLTSFGLPRVGDLDWRLDVRAAPQRAGLVGFATRPALRSFGPGCDWRLDQGPALLVFTDAIGAAGLPVPLRDLPGVYGLELFTQLAVLEPLAARGFTLSAPVRLRIGD